MVSFFSSRGKFKDCLGSAIYIVMRNQSINTKYRGVPLLWLAVEGGATYGTPHFIYISCL